MTVKEIVEQYLIKTAKHSTLKINNDGLCDPDTGCYCKIGDKFMQCGTPNDTCEEAVIGMPDIPEET